MAKSLNEIKIIGNVGQDPDFRTSNNGTSMVRFSVATSNTYKDQQGNKVENTQWHNVVAWRKLAEIIRDYVSKGSKIFVSGEMTYRSYENADGVKVNIAEIVASDVILLTPKKDSDTGYNPEPLPSNNEEDDLPY